MDWGTVTPADVIAHSDLSICKLLHAEENGFFSGDNIQKYPLLQCNTGKL